MTITNQNVTELYIATFNRAPDAAGLYYWVNQSGLSTLENIAQSFFDQSETQAIYIPSISISDKVTLAYQNLFNRAADTEGLAYWVEQLTSQAISQSNMLIALINGAHAATGSADDAHILDNKTTVGTYYVQANLNDVDAAASVMLGVTSDNATVATATASIDYIVNNSIFLDSSSDAGISHSDHITNQYNSVKVSLKLAQADSIVQFFDDLNGNNQQDDGEYINSVQFSRSNTDYTALLDLVNPLTQDGLPLSDGAHVIKAMQVNETGVISVSLPLNITLDTTAPIISNFGIPSSDGSMVSADNFVTNRFEFSLIGTTERNAAVVLYDESEVRLSETTADSSGNFAFNNISVASEIHGHTYKFSARATDIAGNSHDGNVTPVWVTIDTDQPGSPLTWYDNSYEQVDLMTYVKCSEMMVGQTTGDLSSVTSSYSTDGGATWHQTTAMSASFDIAVGSYTARQIQVKQTDAAGNSSGVTFNSNAFSISSDHDLSTSLLLGYTPPNSLDSDANTVTINTGDDHTLNNGDVFTFHHDVSQILSLHQVGEIIQFNNALLSPMSMNPSTGLVSDQHYFLVKGTYNEEAETFTQNDAYSGYGVATLIIFDGDQAVGSVKQQGMVLVGVSPLHLEQHAGEITLF